MKIEIPPLYSKIYLKTKQVKVCADFHIIAVGGTVGSGKSTLSKYLAWRHNLPLLEIDLFLQKKNGRAVVDHEYIVNLLRNLKLCKKPIIVEGYSILPIIKQFEKNEKFLIYLKNRIVVKNSVKDITAGDLCCEDYKISSVSECLRDIDSETELDKMADFIYKQ